MKIKPEDLETLADKLDSGQAGMREAVAGALRRLSKGEEMFSDQMYVDAARDEHECEGSMEFDDEPKVSRSDDGGAYVQCWVWVPESDLL